MKRFSMAVAAAAILGLAACGDSGGGGGGSSADAKGTHPECKDVESAAAYVQKVSAEISQAVIDKKITAEQAQKAGDKMRAEMTAGVGENAPDRGVGYMCNVMDGLKKELGI